MIVSRWSGTLMKTSRIMFINNRCLSDNNKRYKIILRRMLAVIIVRLG